MSERAPEILLQDIRQAIGRIERYCASMELASFLAGLRAQIADLR